MFTNAFCLPYPFFFFILLSWCLCQKVCCCCYVFCILYCVLLLLLSSSQHLYRIKSNVMKNLIFSPTLQITFNEQIWSSSRTNINLNSLCLHIHKVSTALSKFRDWLVYWYLFLINHFTSINTKLWWQKFVWVRLWR